MKIQPQKRTKGLNVKREEFFILHEIVYLEAIGSTSRRTIDNERRVGHLFRRRYLYNSRKGCTALYARACEKESRKK